MTVVDFLEDQTIQNLTGKYIDTRKEKENAAYNLFTISSYNCHIENFHSDILQSLLNNQAAHHEGHKFLHLFIEYLNTVQLGSLKISDFENVIVTRETGRLDIWIRDETSRKAIIIENKINDAPDMDEQLDRYFRYSEQQKGYSVSAIVYLSLDGLKYAPPTTEQITHLIYDIGAFTNSNNDLVHGWLIPCLNASTNPSSSSFIYQYINLIKHLANKNMDNNTMEDFYSFISSNKEMDTVNTIIEMKNRLTTYRAEKFAKEIASNFAPFKKQYRYKPYYYCYESYWVDGNNLKVDVAFEENGSAVFIFWNTSLHKFEGRPPLTKELIRIGWESKFDDEISHGYNGYVKHFNIGNEFQSMIDVDIAITNFMKDFLKALNSNIQIQKS